MTLPLPNHIAFYGCWQATAGLALAALLSAGTLAAASSPEEVSATTEYRLVWADEFDQDGAPDPTNWTYEHGFVRNHEAQFYRPENAWVADGQLVIETRREAVPNPRHRPGARDWRARDAYSTYTSACLHTRGLRDWTYGRFELRARIPTGSGLWPAWWTLGLDREWPHNGEIDIMEYYRGLLLANVAWGTPRRWQAAWDSVRTPLADLGGAAWAREFHVWRMDWTEDHIRLYVDDRLLNETRVQRARNPDGFLPFRQPHYMLLNVALGGDNGGPVDDDALPARMEVDWVRVYQAVEPDAPTSNVVPVTQAPPTTQVRGESDTSRPGRRWPLKR